MKHFILYFLIAALFLIAYVWERIRVETLSMEFQERRSEQQRLENIVAYLKADLMRKAQYHNIESIAKDELGLIFPERAPVTLNVPPPPEKSWLNRNGKVITTILNTLGYER